MIYLDHAATTPLRPAVAEAMRPYMEASFGNPSGIHGVSRTAKNGLEEARERVASLLGAHPMEIVFTGGGTEADNLAIKGVVFNSNQRTGLVTSSVEHEAVLETADYLKRSGHPVSIIGVDSRAIVDPVEVAAAVSDDTGVVSVMLVNNETGSLQDVTAISEAVKARDPAVAVHTDAVQGFYETALDVDALGVDLLSLSAHKFGGPKGAGVLYVREGIGIEPLLHGGGQELGRRSGTQDVASAVGVATAMELAASERDRFDSEIRSMRDRLEDRLLESVPGSEPNTPRSARSAHHLNLRLPGINNETLLMVLDQAGTAASAGSACQSGAATVSHVLEAMGLTPEQARESIRLTLGWTTTEEEVGEAADEILEAVRRLR